jgi:hypothetical protein
MRTIVISDIHGYPELIEHALEHSGFRPGEDRFVFAGDFMDGGPGVERALQLIEELADVILLGNHEMAAMFGMEIMPQDPHAFDYAGRLSERMLDLSGKYGERWKILAEEQGVLVSHSCISEEFAPEWDESGHDLTRFAERLNSEFRVVIARAGLGKLEAADEEEAMRLLGPDGPLWYRPLWGFQKSPLPGLVQVVGHTPPEAYESAGVALLESQGVHLIAPDVSEAEWGEPDAHWLEHAYRYGVIEDGRVRVKSWGG